MFQSFCNIPFRTCNIYLVLLWLIFPLALNAMSAGEDANVIISELRQSYIIKSKDGNIDNVKLKSQTTFLARRADAKVLDHTYYNDDISIDKASAPGAKPIYRASESGDVFWDGARRCLLLIPLKVGKPAKSTIEQTYKSPEQFSLILLQSNRFIEKLHTEIVVPADLAERLNFIPYKFIEGMNLSVDKSPTVRLSILLKPKMFLRFLMGRVLRIFV